VTKVIVEELGNTNYQNGLLNKLVFSSSIEYFENSQNSDKSINIFTPVSNFNAEESINIDVYALVSRSLIDQNYQNFKDSLVYLENSDLTYFGSAKTFEKAHTPVKTETQNSSYTFHGYSLISPINYYTKYGNYALTSPDKYFRDGYYLREDMKQVEDDTFTTIFFEWSTPPESKNGSLQETYAKLSIDMRADLVIGITEGSNSTVENYKKGFIIYSGIDKTLTENNESLIEITLYKDELINVSFNN
jgi:hypothetical protein